MFLVRNLSENWHGGALLIYFLFYFRKSMKAEQKKEGRKEMFYLTTHSTHFIYGYMASDIW